MEWQDVPHNQLRDEIPRAGDNLDCSRESDVLQLDK